MDGLFVEVWCQGGTMNGLFVEVGVECSNFQHLCNSLHKPTSQ